MSAPSGDHVVDPSVRITLLGLVSARWVLILILIAVGILAELLPSLGTDSIRWFGERSNLLAIVASVLLWGATNFAVWKWVDRLSAYGNHVAGVQLVGDIIALTVLIGLTGGAANPFTVLFVVPITLATQVSPRWTWGVAIASVVAFGVLLEVAPAATMNHMPHESMGDHLRGMWLSLGLAGALITFFVHRIALGIAAQRDELARLRDAARRDRELARIGTLAAGAAHELGTPLATLTVLAGELEYMSTDEKQEAIVVMRAELARCKHIIGSMASSELRAEALSLHDVEAWRLEELADELDERIPCQWEKGRSIDFVPKKIVVGAVKELVANALAASSKIDEIHIEGSRDEDGIRLQITDKGGGMTEEVLAAATDPFFTTQSKPDNMGLGLFLVSSQLRSCGGELSIQSTVGKGTTMQIYVPETEDE